MNRILRLALGLAHAIIESARIEEDRVVLAVRPWRREQLCFVKSN